MDFNAALDTVSAVVVGVDLVADDRPYADFSLDEHGLRYARVLALMEEEGLDVLVLTSEESIRYVSGYNSMIWAAAARWLPGALVVTSDPAAARLVVSAFDAGAAAGTAWTQVDPYADPAELPEKLVGTRAERGGRRRPRRARNRRRLVDDDARTSCCAGSWTALPPAGDASADPVDGADAQERGGDRRSCGRRRNRQRRDTRRGSSAARAGITEEALLVVDRRRDARERHDVLDEGPVPERSRRSRPPRARGRARQRPDPRGGRHDLRGRRRPDPRLHVGHHPHRRRGRGRRQGRGVDGSGDRRERRHARAPCAPGSPLRRCTRSAFSVYEDAGLGGSAGVLFGHGIGLEIWERPFIQRHDDPNEDVRLRPG